MVVGLSWGFDCPDSGNVGAERVDWRTLPESTTGLKLNPAVDDLSPPLIPAATAWLDSYTGVNGPVMDLSQAVPGYPPPDELLQALAQASASTATCGYGAIEGEASLRVAYASHLQADYQASIKAANIHITSGCNQAFVAAVMAVAQQGDAVLMVSPYYFNHESTLAMLGIESRYVACNADNGFLPDIDQIRASLDGVSAFAIVSPNNPTGSVYPPALLAQIFEVCQEKGVWLILDETYRDFTAQRHALFSRPDWHDTLIQLYSFSKSFCIPGHRLGAVTSGERLIGAVAKIMDNLQICSPRAAQVAVAQTIAPLAEWRAGNAAEIENRARALRATLAQIPEWEICAMGAYFAYLRHPFEKHTSVQVARQLAGQMGVSCLPGEFFGSGQQQYLRIAFANIDAQTIAGLAERLRLLRL